MASINLQEKANFTRLSRLLVDKGTEALRNSFDAIHPPVNLPAVLNAARASLSPLKPQVINASQWDLLFPPSGNPADSKTFDVTLLTVLLRNICGLPVRPATWWKTIPPDTDRSLQANIARIKLMRNEAYAHVTSTQVDNTTFENLWQKISQTLVDLKIPRKEIDDLKTCPLGPEEERYVQALIEWSESSDVSITGDNNTIFIGDNLSVNIHYGPSEEKCQVRDISGPTTASISNCYCPDFSYCARKTIDEEIRQIQKGKLKTLIGTIGTGKTSAVEQFIYTNKEKFSISWCLDVSKGEDSIVAELNELANRLGVSYLELFNTIGQKAENESIIFWLDHVEKKPSSEWFRELLNIRSSVYVIITSNNSSLGLDLPDVDEVSVEKFDEALAFLEEIRGKNCDEDLVKLCDHFGWNILGLTAAKVYILSEKVSAREYLKKQYNREAACEVHQYESKNHTRTLYTSVRACLELIDGERFSAIATVSLTSHNMIPEFLLSNQLSSSNHLANKAVLSNLRGQLKSLVHITSENDVRFFSFHAFTQYVIRDMIDESAKADLLYKLAGTFVRYFGKDNRFSKGDFLLRSMRDHAELFLKEWEGKHEDERTLIALARLSELLAFTYTQQQPLLHDKLDVHFENARALLHQVCGITEEDLQHADSLLDLQDAEGLLGNLNDRELYNITDNDLVISNQLFRKLTSKSSELPLSIIEELVFSRTISKQDFALFPDVVKKNEALKRKIDFATPLLPSDVDFLVNHGAAHSAEDYRPLFLPELYLSVIYSFGRNYFYSRNRATLQKPGFYVNLLKLAYCLSREINKQMDRREAVFHEYSVQSNALLYLLVNDDCISKDDTCVKKDLQVHCKDLENAIDRYQQLIRDERRFFEMGMLKKTNDDSYSKLVCYLQILRCHTNLITLGIFEDCGQYIESGLQHCDDILELLRTYAAQKDREREDLVQHSKYLNAVAQFYLSFKGEEYYYRVIEIFTLSAEHSEQHHVAFYVEALVGLADVFSRIGKRRFSATRVSVRHLMQCNSKESLRQMISQNRHIRERIRKIQKQNLATVVMHCVQLQRSAKRVSNGKVSDDNRHPDTRNEIRK